MLVPKSLATRLSGSLFGLAALLATSVASAQVPPPNFVLDETPRTMPDIRFANGDGGELHLSDFRGKVVLLNIWATWCAPCRQEMPTLDRLQAELGGPRFEVVALSIDRAGVGAVRKFFREIGIEHLAIYIDESGRAAQSLGVVGLPTTILFDAQGRKVGHLVGPAEWDTPEVVGFLRGRLPEKSGARRETPGSSDN